MKKLFFFSLVVALFLGCRGDELKETNPLPNQQSDNSELKKGVNANLLNSEPTIQTLSELASTPGAYLAQVPQNYQLSKQGYWDYQQAYLLRNSITHELIGEVYAFDQENYGNFIQNGECNLRITLCQNAHICCKPNGNNCSWHAPTNTLCFCVLA